MKRPRLLPPAMLLIALVAMLVLHVVIPGPLWAAGLWQLGGGILAIGGLALQLGSAGLFRRRGTPVRPFEESSILITDGPYRFTRNAMYLGMVLMLVGVGLALGSTTPLGVAPLFTFAVTRRFILAEERALSAQFGATYDAYCANVRRWL